MHRYMHNEACVRPLAAIHTERGLGRPCLAASWAASMLIKACIGPAVTLTSPCKFDPVPSIHAKKQGNSVDEFRLLTLMKLCLTR